MFKKKNEVSNVELVDKETIIKQEKAQKLSKEEKKLAKKQNQKQHFFKRYFYGVGKEFQRVSWTPKKSLFTSFIVVVIIIAFFALVFTGVTIGITAIK